MCSCAAAQYSSTAHFSRLHGAERTATEKGKNGKGVRLGGSASGCHNHNAMSSTMQMQIDRMIRKADTHSAPRPVNKEPVWPGYGRLGLPLQKHCSYTVQEPGQRGPKATPGKSRDRRISLQSQVPVDGGGIYRSTRQRHHPR